MRWLKRELLRIESKSIDKLGNQIEEIKIESEIKIRVTNFTAEDVAVFGRDVVENNRKLITPYRGDLEDKLIKIDNIIYKISKVEELERFNFALIERWRGHAKL